ncbi:MAG: primase C-terminal domain-containing protein, partial [Bacteroidetes bacterium]|nr:primase C-terminal domain-containing protein [Bacteroidota bacterium]
MENINNQSLKSVEEQGKDNEFSLFIKPITNNKPLKNVTIDEVYEVVKGDYYKEVTDKLRNETNKDTQKTYKASELDYVCFSGAFVTRKNTDLEKHSNLLCIDFDDLNEVESTKEKIIKTLPPRLLFRSPSGNGLKVVYPIDTSTNSHLDYFNYFESFFKDKLGLEIDKACKDVARACFLCHDPQAYKNENSPTITIQTPQQMSYDVIIENLEKWLQNKGEHFVNGNRNNYSTQLANALNRYGVPENETLNHLFLYAQEDFPQSEIQATVRSVYNHTEWHGISTFDENKPYAFPKGEEAEKEEKTPLLPIDGFPKFLQDYINEFKRVYNTPRDYIAGAVLFAVAFAIGDKLELVRKYKNIPLLWMATVGDVSTQKSMPTNTVLSYFRDRDNKEYSSFSKAITEYEK